MDVFLRDRDLLRQRVAGLGEPLGRAADELVGRRGAGGEADRLVPVQQRGVELALAVDQRRLRARRLRDLDEPLRVRARLRADHEHERRALRDHRLHRVLPVLRRVADVVGVRPAQAAEMVLERVHDRRDVVEGERRLRDHRHRLVRRELAGLLRRLDHDRRVGPLAHRPDHLDVVLVADERDEMAAVGVAPRLRVHLVHERARRVDDPEAALLRVLLHRRGDAVRGEDADLALRDLRLVLDEDGAQRLEPADDVLVVDDLVADVDRRAVLLEQAFHDLDRPVDAGAERARRGEEHAAPHATASRSARSARSASRIERSAPARRVATQRSSPATSVRPSGWTVESTPSTMLAASSEMARTTPASRPLRARTPLSMSTASAPLAARRRARSAASWTSTSPPRTTLPRAPRTPRPGPSQSVLPVSSTTRVASSTSPTRRSPSEPARPNETTRPSGTPFAAQTPTRTAARPARFATRSSAVVAQANVNPSASTRGSARSP